ncbi:MAG: MotA/TolQ/ExbB proton channel family protein [Porphyromonadaceae bacterium]|nr:MotA/TolQ/ExbB proton channel family protein [Porphyromonadaceae bacterium]
MNTITQMLFWVSNSLLIPNIIILLILFIRALILLGSFYNSFMLRRKSRLALLNLDKKSANEIRQMRQELQGIGASLVGKYTIALISNPNLTQADVDYQLSQFETETDRDLSTCKLLAKVGPVLGLIGTLISMSPALMGLSTGNIEGMAYNMQIVFATTVVGLVISLVGLVTQQYKQRWYAEEMNALELMSARLIN